MRTAWMIGIVAAFCVAGIGQNKSRTVWDGVYTADQVKRGEDAFTQKCALCHGGDMQGGPEAPALNGVSFMVGWGGKNAGELYTYLRTTMPPDAPGTVSDQRYADLMAAIFNKNDFPAGSTPLTPDPRALADILIAKEKP